VGPVPGVGGGGGTGGSATAGRYADRDWSAIRGHSPGAQTLDQHIRCVVGRLVAGT
jgi:hypothetical protein